MLRLLRQFIVPVLAIAPFAASVGAQRDTTARAVTATTRSTDSVPKAPLGPRRAFLYSFLIPGYSQTVLGRNKAAAAFVLAEAISIAMIRESAADVHEARRIDNDSIVVSYVDAQGNALVMKSAPRFTDADVHTRLSHVEDWIALLVANHLFSGADAFVSANLWDVPIRLGVRALPDTGSPSAIRTALVATFVW